MTQPPAENRAPLPPNPLRTVAPDVKVREGADREWMNMT
jgi:hypothetical protein